MKKLFFSILFAASITGNPVFAAALPDMKNCPALGDEKAYGKKFDDIRFLLPGKSGWYFRSRSDMYDNYTTDDLSTLLQKGLVKALHQRGTELIIVYIPTRAVAAKAFLPPSGPLTHNYDPDAAAKNYATLIDDMQKYGVDIVGIPDPAAKEAFFYKTDQHWTTRGASEMADVVAAKIKSFPAYADIAKKTFKTDIIKPPAEIDGTFNRVFKKLCNSSAPIENDNLTLTTLAEETEDAGGLFGDQGVADIVLTGTSNSHKQDNNLNFDGLLKQRLSADVTNVAISSGGMGDSILSYLASDAYRQHPPKFLLWEIPGYYDLAGDGTRNLLRELIPTTYGMCDDAYTLDKKTVQPTTDKTLLFELPDTEKHTSGEVYVVLKTNPATKDAFSLTATYQDGVKAETIKLRRSKRYPADGIYHVSPRTNAILSSLTLNRPIKAAADWKVEAKLCVYPNGPIVPPKPAAVVDNKTETAPLPVQTKKTGFWARLFGN